MPSTYKARVRPLTAASILSKSCGFTKRVVIPNWGRMSLNRVNVPPYRLFAETISSPCFARLTIVEKMADVPDAEANAPTPPSNRLIRSSSMACVGLPSRP